MTINKDRIQSLVDALRSGRYKQGRQALRPDEDTYCCLGVACELYRQEGCQGAWKKNHCSDGYAFFASDEQNDWSPGSLPLSVQEWYGFMLSNPSVDSNTVAEMNDQGEGFPAIADAIEETYLK